MVQPILFPPRPQPVPAGATRPGAPAVRLTVVRDHDPTPGRAVPDRVAPTVTDAVTMSSVSRIATRLAAQRSVGEVFGQLVCEVLALIPCRAAVVLRRDADHWFVAACAGETGRRSGQAHAQLMTAELQTEPSPDRGGRRSHHDQTATGVISDQVEAASPLGLLGHRFVVMVPLVRLGHEFGVLCVYLDRLDPAASSERVDPTTLATIVGRHAVIASGAAMERQQLTRAMESRHQVGVAQGLLMARLGLDADESFALLRDWSQHGNVKLRVVAERVIAERAVLARDARLDSVTELGRGQRTAPR